MDTIQITLAIAAATFAAAVTFAKANASPAGSFPISTAIWQATSYRKVKALLPNMRLWSLRASRRRSGTDPVRRTLALPLLIVVCMGVELPRHGPVPLENPRQLRSAEKTIPVPPAKPAAQTGIPEMPEKTGPDTTQEPSAKSPPTGSEEQAALPGISAPEISEAGLANCEAELRKLGAVFKSEDPVRGKNGCGIEAPYRLDQIVRGVKLSPASQLRCDTALSLARWIDTVVVPATAALPGGITLTGVNHGSSYICRRRNNSASGKMSEHAIGNAVDVVGFGFKGRDPIAVSPRAGDGTVEEAFQRAIRGGACLHFTTVLGPGANASHDDHLHLDIITRKGGYRLCE